MEKKSIESPKKPSVFPVVFIVLAVIVVFIAFIGSFAYSFVKSKILNKVSDLNSLKNSVTGLSDLQKLTGGSTIKSKAEGINVCRQSKVDYCWPLVALSFNDMSVCNLAPDPKACETEAKQFKEDFKGGGEDVAPTKGLTPSEDAETIRKCNKETMYQTTAGKIAIIGKDSVDVEGTRYETCCWEATSYEGGEPGKTCKLTDQPEDSMVLYRYVDNRYILESVSMKKGGQDCSYIFEEDGSLVNKMCQ